MTYSGMKFVTRLILSVSIATATLSANSYAAEGKKSSAKIKSGKKTKKPKTSTPEPEAASDDSRAASGSAASGSAASGSGAAKKKQILGTLEPIPLLSVGVSAAMLAPNGSGLEADFSLGSGKKGAVAASIIHLGARYRKPIMKLIYVAGGGGLRMASGAWNVLSVSDPTAQFPVKTSFNAVTLDGAVGGQMSFGSIILGADLLGISFPLFKLGVKKPVLDPDANTSDANTQQGAFDKLAGGMTLTLLKVGVGIAF